MDIIINYEARSAIYSASVQWSGLPPILRDFVYTPQTASSYHQIVHCWIAVTPPMHLVGVV